MAKLLYQPHYHNGGSWEDAHTWASDTVYETENEAIEDILSDGFTDKGRRSLIYGYKLYDDAEEDFFGNKGYAWIEVLTLGGTE